MFMSHTFLLWAVLGLVVPFLLAGWSGLLWGGLVRVFLTHHVTWSVNSVCHTFGQRMFETKDQSRNQWLVGLLAFGEGWHNNHHAFPRSAMHGLRWWQFDLSAYIIRLLEKIGLVWNVNRVSTANLQARMTPPPRKEPSATR